MRISSAIIIVVSFAATMANASEELEEIRVTAHPLGGSGLAQDTKVLSGDQLAEKMQGSLGETLATEVGIQSASFGTAVGRPVIHGLGGPRIKTTEDRIDSLDVSVTSSDHAVTVEPFIANRVTILKGASTLLYGGGAIGGVVDVETGRIAKEISAPLTGRVEVRTADNANASVAAARLDGFSNNFAWHIDAFVRDAGDYEIPGLAESEMQLAREQSSGESHELETGSELFGSRAKNNGAAVGLSYIAENGFVGFSVSTLDATYGLVGAHEDEEHSAPAAAFELPETPGVIELGQTRYDFEAQLDNPFAGFEALNLRAGINDYQHQEIEANGDLGTEFDNQAWEGRLELRHSAWGGFQGTIGVQLNAREFKAVGEEAFVPPVESASEGIFWLVERQFADIELELGARLERLSHRALDSTPAAPAARLKFNTASLSAGLVKDINDQLTIAALVDYSSRAPSIEELYANGPHLATQSFEIGDPKLATEAALGVNLTASYANDRLESKVSAYLVDFDDFIYQENIGSEEDGLPVLEYRQQQARFFGVDLEALIHLGTWPVGDFDLALRADTVTGRLSSRLGSDRDLPRIPAARVGAGIYWQNKYWRAKLDYTRVQAQRKVAAIELPTNAYNDWSLYLGRELSAGDKEITVFFHGRNLSNDEQRHHTSFIKDLAPAPGRRFEVGLRFSF